MAGTSISFSVLNSGFTLRDFTFDDLRNKVNGDYNVGELRFEGGKLHSINSHQFWTALNNVTTQPAENLLTRNAVMALLDSKFGGNANLTVALVEVRAKLLGDGASTRPISRDEVRFMINLLESESSQSSADDRLSPEQVREKLDISERLKTCGPAVREAWARLNPGSIRQYIKEWGRADVLNTVSRNVRSRLKGQMPLNDPASALKGFVFMRSRQGTSALPNGVQDLFAAPAASRQQVRGKIAMIKARLMDSLKTGLDAAQIDMPGKFADGFKASIGNNLRQLLGKAGPQHAKILKAQLANLKLTEDGEPFCVIGDAFPNVEVDANRLNDQLKKCLVDLVMARAAKALDGVFASCVTDDDVKNVLARPNAMSFFDCFGESGSVKLLEAMRDGKANEMDEGLFGKANFGQLVQTMSGAVVRWEDLVVGLDETFADESILPMSAFVQLKAIHAEPSLETRIGSRPAQGRETLSDVYATVWGPRCINMLGTGAGNYGVGLNLQNLHNERVTEFMLDQSTDLTYILRDEKKFERMTADWLRKNCPEIWLGKLKSLVRAYRILRPVKRLASPDKGSYYAYCRHPKGFRPQKALHDAKGVLCEPPFEGELRIDLSEEAIPEGQLSENDVRGISVMSPNEKKLNEVADGIWKLASVLLRASGGREEIGLSALIRPLAKEVSDLAGPDVDPWAMLREMYLGDA